MLGSTVLRPSPALGDIVEAIWDVDVPDGAFARGLAVTLLPTAAAIMVVHYRSPITSDRRNYRGFAYKSVVTGVQRETVTLRPSGPTGAIAIRFRPGAAARIFGEMAGYADANVELADVFGEAAPSRLEQQLAMAPDQTARRAAVEAFLCRRVTRDRDPLIGAALGHLRHSPATRIARLARVLDTSERQLERRFLAAVGAAPKQVARVLRVEGLIAARHRGAGWADIAACCGFTDQAHMIRDFRALAGATPDAFMRATLALPRRTANTALAMSGFYNTAFV